MRTNVMNRTLVVHLFSCSTRLWLQRHQLSRISSSSGTVRKCLNNLEAVFRSAGVSEPNESAVFIIAHALGKKTLHGVDTNLPLTDHVMKNIEHMSSQRLRHLPVQYVIGEWDFHSLTLGMKSPVFIPRPETEDLVEHALSDPVVRRAEHFLEIGCGSGAICIALLKQLPMAWCTAVERSEAACELAHHNAVRNNVNNRLNIINAKWAPEIFDRSRSQRPKFDFLISNPPYISTKDMDSLQPEVIRYEDHCALHGGTNGMDVIEDILRGAHRVLKTGSSVWLEVDCSHPTKVLEFVGKESVCRLEYVKSAKDFTQSGTQKQFIEVPSRLSTTVLPTASDIKNSRQFDLLHV